MVGDDRNFVDESATCVPGAKLFTSEFPLVEKLSKFSFPGKVILVRSSISSFCGKIRTRRVTLRTNRGLQEMRLPCNLLRAISRTIGRASRFALTMEISAPLVRRDVRDNLGYPFDVFQIEIDATDPASPKKTNERTDPRSLRFLSRRRRSNASPFDGTTVPNIVVNVQDSTWFFERTNSRVPGE